MTIGRIPSVEGGIQPTIVDAKGDLIAGVAADSVNRLAVGSNDQVLVADSSASTGLAWKSYGAQVVAGKNAVINGGMDLWQRGTSIAGTGAVQYCADRWQMGANTASTVSRQATGDTTNLPFIQYSARVQRTSGSTSTTRQTIVTSIESANSIPFAGKTITLSFYARAGANYSATSSALGTGFYTGTGTDQNIFSGFTGQSSSFGSFTLTTTWQRFTQTITMGATATQLAVQFYYDPPAGTAGANDWFEVTGVQIEVGSVATPFSRAGGTIQGELAACQRYYIRMTNDGASDGLGPDGSAFNTGGITAQFNPPVKMRVTPTSVDWSNIRLYDGVTVHTVTAVTLGGCASGAVPQADFSATTLTQYRYYRVIANTGSSFIGFNAEL